MLAIQVTLCSCQYLSFCVCCAKDWTISRGMCQVFEKSCAKCWKPYFAVDVIFSPFCTSAASAAATDRFLHDSSRANWIQWQCKRNIFEPTKKCFENMKTRNRKGFLDESVLPKGWARQNPLIRGQGQPKICKKNSMSIIFCQTPINSGPSPPPQKWQWGFQWILMPAHKMGFQRVHCSALRWPLQPLHHWQPLLGAHGLCRLQFSIWTFAEETLPAN